MRLLKENFTREEFIKIVNSNHYEREEDDEDKAEVNEKEKLLKEESAKTLKRFWSSFQSAFRPRERHLLLSSYTRISTLPSIYGRSQATKLDRLS